jgi:hypothetical protein
MYDAVNDMPGMIWRWIAALICSSYVGRIWPSVSDAVTAVPPVCWRSAYWPVVAFHC